MPELGEAVRDHRRAALARAMDRAGVPALMLAGADWFEHATNHPLAVQAWERPYLLVVSRDGRAAAVLPDIARNRIDAQRARGTLWLDEVAYYSEQPRQSGRRRLVHQMPELAAEIVDAMGLARGRLGVDTAGGPAARVAALLPELRLVAAQRWLRDARLVKHGEEIATMRVAAAIADHALARYAQEIRPGRLLQELDHLMAAVACVEAARVVPGEDFHVLKFQTLSGPAAASPHGDGGQAGARALDDAVAVTICNVRLNGLSIEDQRSFLCGEPGAAMRRVVETARHATAAGVEAAVAGAPVAGIDAATQAVIEAAGYGEYLLHRTGHGIGVATHEYPEDMAFDPRPLLAGEVVVVEPGIYVPGAGAARFVDVVAVGAPSEVLTRAPRDALLAPVSVRAA